MRALVVALLIAPTVILGDGGYYRDASNKHSDPNTGVFRDATLPRGGCNQCHVSHPGDHDYGLFAEQVTANDLCIYCHNAQTGTGRIWTGSGDYSNSGHGTAIGLYDPGSGAGAGFPVKICTQCHNPHGNGDGAHGLYSSLLHRFEENSCLSNNSSGTAGTGCHGDVGGYRPVTNNYPTGAPDIYTPFAFRTYKHPVLTVSGVHRPNEAQTVNSGAFSGQNRHSECEDCHNSHLARFSSQTNPTYINHVSPGNSPGKALIGTWGVQPNFGAAWVAPTSFVLQTFSDNGITNGTDKESWLCYKCHSYFAYAATPPVPQTDAALEFNTANLSFHPVEGLITTGNRVQSYTKATPGVNGGVETMEAPWANGNQHKLMTCTDCHRSDQAGDAAGPHASNTQWILRKNAGTTYATLDNAFCLECHKTTVYAPAADPGATQTGSRFDQRTTGVSQASHYFHVTAQGNKCRACHAGTTALNGGGGNPEPGTVHGTNLVGTLMNGLNITSYSWPDGAPGSCASSCHALQNLPAVPK